MPAAQRERERERERNSYGKELRVATDHALLSSRQQKAWYVPAFKSPGKEVVPIHPGGKVIAVKKLLLSATRFLFNRTPHRMFYNR